MNPYQMQFGDSLNLLHSLEAETVDAVVTDPPYSSGAMMRSDRLRPVTEKYSGAKRPPPTFSGDNRDGRSWTLWMSLWIGSAMRVLRPGGYILVFTDWRQLPSCTDAMQCGGAVWRGVVVWDKTEGCRPQRGCFRNQAEYIIWGTKGPIDQSRGVWPGVFRYSMQSEPRHHLVGKPVALMRELVRCVPEGGLILDPFAGSGSTGVACLETGRRFIGMEMDQHYYEIASSRLAGAAGIC